MVGDAQKIESDNGKPIERRVADEEPKEIGRMGGRGEDTPPARVIQVAVATEAWESETESTAFSACCQANPRLLNTFPTCDSCAQA